MENMEVNVIDMGKFNNIYDGKKVFVTGHTGFKGSWLTLWLKKLGADVMGYSLEPNTNPNLFNVCKCNSKCNSIIGDIRDYEKLNQSLNEYKPDIVFHLAAQPIVRLSYEKAKLTYETNIMGTVNLLEICKNIKSIKSVVVITTDKCYENKESIYGYRENDPMGGFDPYSSSKACVELIVSAYRDSFYNKNKIGLSSARAGNVIGGGDWAQDRLIPDFVREVSNSNIVVIRNPDAIRPWQHVLEPLSGYLWLGALMYEDTKRYSSSWNFGPEDNNIFNVSDILNLAIKSWGEGNIKVDKNEQLHEAKLLRLDITKAKTYLKWEPIYNMDETVDKTIKWYKTYYAGKDDIVDFTLSQIENYECKAYKKDLLWNKQKGEIIL
ncbi:CDP-glucose 4,6-dehydratase [Clostridium tyrobutyricum]|uniref:CDP-glucose 4,6-dehydratase n=1 Tax=Clostridium tyrobutyricum TaxID=1519 RepID=UPI00030D1B05|nr:CDP-glucose 4,6-dehydratase [Clostridium tyrobutyricum]